MCVVQFNDEDMTYHVIDLDTMQCIDKFDDPLIAYEFSSHYNQD